VIPVPEPEAHKAASTADTEAENAASDAWLDALGGVVKRVPVMGEDGVVIDHVPVPIIGGKIEGGAPDKVLFYRCPDNALRGFRVFAGDLLLTVPASRPETDRLMLVSVDGKRMVRKLLMLDGGLIRETAGLEPEDFSSQYLGKIYAVLRRRLLEGRAIQLGMLEGELDREEIELLAEILRQPEALEQGSKAMADYRAILEAEGMKRQVSDETDLLALRDRLRQKKSI
jgi:hypothetical protein